jgi:hypothetical protein
MCRFKSPAAKSTTARSTNAICSGRRYFSGSERALRERSEIPMPARTTNSAAARPSTRSLTQTRAAGPLLSAFMRNLKLTRTMPKTAPARDTSMPGMRAVAMAAGRGSDTPEAYAISGSASGLPCRACRSSPHAARSRGLEVPAGLRPLQRPGASRPGLGGHRCGCQRNSRRATSASLGVTHCHPRRPEPGRHAAHVHVAR